MSTLVSPNNVTEIIAAGLVLSITGNANIEWYDAANALHGPITITGTNNIGPFASDMRLKITANSGTVTYSTNAVSNTPSNAVPLGLFVDDVSFATLTDFNTAGGAAAYPNRPIWIGGVQYWSDGVVANSTVSNKIKKFTLFESFETTPAKTISLTGGSFDTTNFIVERGVRLSLTYSGTGTNNSFAECASNESTGLGGGYVFDPALPIILSVYVNGGTNANLQLGIYLSNNNFAGSPSTISNLIPVGALRAGFQTIAIPARFMKNEATSDLTSLNYKKMRVYLRVTGGSAGDLHDVTILAVYQAKAKPKIVIGFDDAIGSVYSNAYPLMQSLGLKGSVSVIGSTVGGSYETYPAMTLTQLREIKNSGWELTTHGTTQHATLGSESAITADIASNKAFLINNGLTGGETIYIYPGGSVLTAGNASYNSLAANGMTAAFVTAPYGEGICFVGEGIKAGYKTNRFALTRQKMAQDDFTPTENAFRRLLDYASNGLPCFLYMHGVPSGGAVDAGRGSTDISMVYFEQFMRRFASYKSMGLVEDCTVAELLASAPTNKTDYTY